MELDKELISKLFQSKTDLISEEELEKTFPSLETYQSALKQIGKKFEELGLELIRTTFEGKKYFIIGIQSKTAPIPEDLLGVLIFIAAYLKENNELVPRNQFENVFADVLPDVEQLVTLGYIQKKEENYILHPRTKILLKNIYKNLDFQRLI